MATAQNNSRYDDLIQGLKDTIDSQELNIKTLVKDWILVRRSWTH